MMHDNSMQKLDRNITLLLMMILLYSCKRHLDAGIHTNISGVVFDNNSQQPMPNTPIYIYEYGAGFYGPQYKATIDSTRSAPDGTYTIGFSTTRQGSQYRIGFR